jgi:hypothetical protein
LNVEGIVFLNPWLEAYALHYPVVYSMNSLFSAYFILLLIAPIIAGGVAFYTWRRRAAQSATAVLALASASLGINLGILGELGVSKNPYATTGRGGAQGH